MARFFFARPYFLLNVHSFIYSAWRSGIRGRSFHAVFVFGLLLLGAAYLTGYFSPRQPKTVALDVGLSFLRFALVLLSLFWIQDLVGREIDRKAVIFSLAYPVPRSHYLLGRYIGILMLSLVASLVLGILLWLVVLFAGGGYEQQYPPLLGLPYWAAVLGLWLDVAVVTAFALWVASLSTVAILPLAVGAAFAIGGKSLGAVRDYLAKGAEGDAQLVARFDPVLDIVRWFVPDLSRLDWRAWPMYGQGPEAADMMWAVIMAAAYVALMLILAVMAFRRREFV